MLFGCSGSKFALYNHRLDHHRSICGNNYGSIFNITNNCSGKHGGFWQGFGTSLGLNLGGMVGGLFGSFMGGFPSMFGGFGMGFGNMLSGMNNFWGLSGMFQPNWGNYSQYGDNGYNSWLRVRGTGDNDDDKCNCGSKCKCENNDSADDPDNKKIAEYKDNITKATTREELERYQKELTELRANLEENSTNDTDVETLAIDNLLDQIEEKIKTFSSTEKVKGEEQGQAEVETIDIDGTTKNITELTKNEIISITDITNLTDKQITEIAEKVKEMVDFNANDPYADVKDILESDIPDDLKNKIKEQFYEQGFTNATLDELNSNDIVVKYARDVVGNARPDSDPNHINDVGNINNNSPNVAEDKTITITDAIIVNGAKYTYVAPDTENYPASCKGEVLFKSQNNDQYYVLQKNGNNFVLNQYFWHTGSGIKDYSGL